MEQEWLIYGGIFFTGVVSVVAYYLSKFYFSSDEKEKVEQLEESGESAAEAFKSTDKDKVLVSEDGKPVSDDKKVATGDLVSETNKGEKLASEGTKSLAEDLKPKPVRKDLGDALSNTKSTLLGKLKSVFTGQKDLSGDELESLEEVLYTSDLGPKTVQQLVEAVGSNLESSEKSDYNKVCTALKNEMVTIFDSINSVEESSDSPSFVKVEGKEEDDPQVWMIVGVNGAGKTTTIGKLANLSAKLGQKTLVVAGDTFRAAAEEQLNVWSERAGVEIFSPEGVKDPSAVIFDGCSMAKSKNFDVVIIDTAGRLHTQDNLMEELKKIKRVVKKVLPEAPNETLIVLDSNSGQNALMQVERFNEAMELTGAILTKLDGTAKGGVAVGLAFEHSLPIKAIGVGEGIDDLRSFNSKEFVDSII